MSDFNLDRFKVFEIPDTAYYVPEFITEEEENYLLSNIYTAPKPKWTQLSNRRLQNWGGVPHSKGMIAEAIPEWLTTQLDKIHSLNVFETVKPNHVLINEYLPGQGIMAHLDGTLFYPTITTISLKSHIVLRFTEAEQNMNINPFSLLLEPRSLLILKEDMFYKYLHCIEEIDVDIINENIKNLKLCSGKYALGSKVKRDTRISLTIRHVPKTTTFKLNIGCKR